MIWAIALLLGLLTWFNHDRSKSLLYPPTLFAGIWFVSLVALILADGWFYPVSEETLGIYAAGAIAFSIGGAAVASVRRPPMAPASLHVTSPITLRCLDIVLVASMVGLPFFWWSATANNDASDLALFFAMQRLADVEMSASSERTFDAIRNLVVVSQFLAVAMFYHDHATSGRRMRTVAAVLLALVYGAITGAKIHAMILAGSLVFVSALRRRQLNWRVIVVTASASLVVFCAGLLAINLTYVDAPFSMEGIVLAARASLDYWLGGIVAFDQVVQNPHRIEATQSLARVMMETANGFGWHFAIPSVHASYVNASSTAQVNVYTMYFAYLPDVGLGGAVIALALIGATSTWLYARAWRGSPIALLMYSRVCISILLSVFAENFVLSLNMYVKLLVFLVSVYELAPRIAARFFPALGTASLVLGADRHRGKGG